MIRACVFDLGNVLVFFSHERMCQQIAELCGVTTARIFDVLMGSGVLDDLECGRVSDEEFHAQFTQTIGVHVSLAELKQAASDIFWLNTDLIAVLASLKRSGMRLILLSNISRPHFEFVQREFDFLHYFDDFTLSYEVGSMKPDRAIYLDAIQKSGYQAGECFFTDDLEANAEGARQEGLNAAVFRDVDKLRTDLAQLGVSVK